VQRRDFRAYLKPELSELGYDFERPKLHIFADFENRALKTGAKQGS